MSALLRSGHVRPRLGKHSAPVVPRPQLLQRKWGSIGWLRALDLFKLVCQSSEESVKRVGCGGLWVSRNCRMYALSEHRLTCIEPCDAVVFPNVLVSSRLRWLLR